MQTDVYTLLENAYIEYQEKNLDKALQLYREALTLDPINNLAQVKIKEIEWSKKDNLRSFDLFFQDILDLQKTQQYRLLNTVAKEYINNNKSNIDKLELLKLYVQMGKAKRRQNLFIEAKKYYQKALEINHEDRSVNLAMSAVLCDLKFYQDSLNYLSKAEKNKMDDISYKLRMRIEWETR